MTWGMAIALANKLARIAWGVLAHGKTSATGDIAEATAYELQSKAGYIDA